MALREGEAPAWEGDAPAEPPMCARRKRFAPTGKPLALTDSWPMQRFSPA